MNFRPFLFTALLTSALVGKAHADARLEGVACRSVHLAYTAEPATAFYNEVCVTESAPGAYFMVSGFTGGYAGIQELANGKKVVIFSLWDAHHTNDPKALSEEKRTQVVYQGGGVRTGRFGGEGTGGQSFFEYDWKKGSSYRFLVTVRPGENGRQEYTGYFYVPEAKEWKRLATFSSPYAPARLTGLYSFVEDFRRNRESTKFTRRANFGPAYVLDDHGAWQAINRAQFTGDGNPVMNIDAGLADKRFFLATGGAIENKTVNLWASFENPDVPPSVPEDVSPLVGASPKACCAAK